MIRRATGLLAALLPALAGCGGYDSGAKALLRIRGAQFFPGATPAEADGPKVASVDLSTNLIEAGELAKPLKGALDERATAAAIGLRGDRGYWVVPAGLPDITEPGFPTYSAALDFSPDLPSGTYDLVVRAVDAAGRFGPESPAPLATEKPDALAAPLVVSLRWDTEADLDLRVVDPNGVEIWKRDINSYQPPPPGKPVDPTAVDKGGVLDIDSNAACVIDGRRREQVIWKVARPAGRYVVRVDTFSLCGEPAARWRVDVFAGGRPVAAAEGTSTETDTRMPHDRGAGLTAVEFEMP